jgi:hypothetical protein
MAGQLIPVNKEQVVNGVAYASYVLGILLNVNRWVKKVRTV